MVEIGVVFGYIVVIATIAVVLVGVVALFILSIKGGPSSSGSQTEGFEKDTRSIR
ncbi:hypothetical protein [Rhodococcus gannanensis]|uniref:Adenylate cyclase n=1 Tax=Rhodococcus gannanensis TaxID=1960308 RepID=A0ABW4P5Y6_9NOCA